MSEIFVFGSNLAGRHGAGAAKTAMREHGARWGQGYGLQGRSFAIPTKDANFKTLHLSIIESYVDLFRIFYVSKRADTFKITRIGCGLAGYKDADIAPMFKDLITDCYYDLKWKPYLGNDYNYWGTF